MLKKTVVGAEHAGKRLDMFLTLLLPNMSRSTIQRLIKQGDVLVNDKPVSVHHFLKNGDKIAFQTSPSKPKKTSSSPSSATEKHAQNQTIIAPKIIAETKNLLVINKPTGLLVHPDRDATEEKTLVDWLIAHDPAIARVGEDPSRPGIVHRIDRDVSGLMVIAKTPLAYESLKKQFAGRRAGKLYRALVHGEVPKEEADIKLRIARSATKARMAARPASERGKPSEQGRASWSHYRVRERFVGATLLDVEILTGRTHQIRAHLHAIGHPVIGDTLYVIKRTPRKMNVGRIMLQCVSLSFDDPETGKRLTFDLDQDSTFDALVQEFRHS